MLTERECFCASPISLFMLACNMIFTTAPSKIEKRNQIIDRGEIFFCVERSEDWRGRVRDREREKEEMEETNRR